MNISIDEIKKLKELTGVGLTDAKKALTEADGNFDKALEEMRKKGLTKAEKRGEREAREGLVAAYIHGGRIGAMVEVNCETDFVARTEDFQQLVHDIAMHVSAMSPEYISLDKVPEEVIGQKRAEFTDRSAKEGKPADIAQKMVEGQLRKYFAEKTLLDQPFIKDQDKTVGEYIKEYISKLGENIVVRQMNRIELGVNK